MEGNVEGVGLNGNGNGNGGVEAEAEAEGGEGQVVDFGLGITKLLVDNTGVLRKSSFELYDGHWSRPLVISSTSTLFYASIEASLRQSGLHDDVQIADLINDAFTQITSLLNTDDKAKLDLVPITLSVQWWGSWEEDEDEDEDGAVEAAMVMEETALKPVPATKESIDALNKVKVVKLGFDNDIHSHVSHQQQQQQQCMICLEELVALQQQGSVELASMPCSHVFHQHCIVNWLNISHLCPLCRFPMPTS